MAGFANDVVYAINGDFSKTGAAKGSLANGLLTDAQMWIGSTATNVGGTHINVGTLTSTGGTVSITYSSPNINLEVSGGASLTEFSVDAHTAPGTNPVVPNGSGIVTVTGNQVAAGTIGANVIRTDSLAANTFTVEVQRSTSNATSDSTKNGVAHFDSKYFSVDSNAFVSSVFSPYVVSAQQQSNLYNLTGDGTLYQLIIDAVSYQTGIAYNSGTGIFTAPFTGNYLVSTSVTLNNLNLGNSFSVLQITTSTQNFYSQFNPGLYTNVTLIRTAICTMTAGDTLVVEVTVSNGAKTVGITGNNLGSYTDLSIQRVS